MKREEYNAYSGYNNLPEHRIGFFTWHPTHSDLRCTECHLDRSHTWAEHDASIGRFKPILGDGRGEK